MIRISSLACVAAAALAVSACNPTPATDTASTTTQASEVQQSQAAAAAVLGALSGGASNPTMTAYVSNFDKVATALSNVKDEASAKAMGEQLAPIFAEMQKQSETLEKMSEQEIAAAAMASMPQLTAAQIKIATSLSTLALENPKLAEIVGQEIEKMPELED